MNAQEVREKLLEIIDKAITEGHWDSSLFAKNIGKRLQEIREYVDHELPAVSNQPAATRQSITPTVASKPGHRLLYIALYQAEGLFLDRWLSTLKLLVGHSVSRPVYAKEDEVRAMIRARPNPKKSEAYAAVWVKESDILPSHAGARTQDRLGHQLLALKENSIRLENLVAFVHDDKRYQLLEDELVLESELRRQAGI